MDHSIGAPGSDEPCQETSPLLGDPEAGPPSGEAAAPADDSFRSQAIGVSAVVTAGMLFTVANVLQTQCLKEIHFFFLLLVRGLIQMAIATTDLAVKRIGPLGGSAEPWQVKAKVVGQGALGGLLLLCVYYTVAHIPIGNASAIFFCSPMFTFMFATVTLDEKLGLFRVMLSLFMLGGVTLMSRPPFIFGHEGMAVHFFREVV